MIYICEMRYCEVSTPRQEQVYFPSAFPMRLLYIMGWHFLKPLSQASNLVLLKTRVAKPLTVLLLQLSDNQPQVSQLLWGTEMWLPLPCITDVLFVGCKILTYSMPGKFLCCQDHSISTWRVEDMCLSLHYASASQALHARPVDLCIISSHGCLGWFPFAVNKGFFSEGGTTLISVDVRA